MYLWRGNGCYLSLHDYLAAVARSRFEPELVVNDRESYELTATGWAQNLDEARERIEARWGSRLYRLFRLYLWSTAVAFETGGLQAYHVVLRRGRPE
jgi:cyclopropane fatty-acyl-phospholipid synthase-like methyltransferase